MKTINDVLKKLAELEVEARQSSKNIGNKFQAHMPNEELFKLSQDIQATIDKIHIQIQTKTLPNSSVEDYQQMAKQFSKQMKKVWEKEQWDPVKNHHVDPCFKKYTATQQHAKYAQKQVERAGAALTTSYGIGKKVVETMTTVGKAVYKSNKPKNK